MISLKNLSVSFADNKVLKDVNADFPLSEVHGVAGLNGSGKTTMFNAIAGFLKLENGEIIFNGRKVTRSDFGFLETDNYFYPNITGNEYLRLFPDSNKKFSVDTFNALFKVPLDEIIETYSNGMRKKLAMMAILKQEKDFYILDEPFNGLDMESCKLVEIVINMLREKGKTLFVSSHILDTLTDSCTFIHHLKDGRIVKSYGKKEYPLLKNEIFEEFRKSAEEVIGEMI
jgi:ABC-2 type transport system ATP-binding protein